LLSEQIAAVLLALVVIGTQTLILWAFGFADWKTNKEAPDCSDGPAAPVCQIPEGKNVKVFSLALMVLLLHTCGDMFKGIQLMIMSIRKKDLDDQKEKSVFVCGFAICGRVLVCGFAIFGLAFATLLVACNFVWQSSDNVVSMVQDVFIVLFVLEVDEKALNMLDYWDPVFTEKVLIAVKVREEKKEKDCPRMDSGHEQEAGVARNDEKDCPRMDSGDEQEAGVARNDA
jgi:hypothetical protein